MQVVIDAVTSYGEKHSNKALFSSVLIKSNNADFMVFSDTAQYRNVNPMDSTITIAQAIKFAAGGTNFHSIFQTMNKKYDRVVILSDMQGWIGQYSPVRDYNEWKKRTGSNPFVYSFDLNSYGSMQLPEQNVFCLAGFSDKIFNIMSLLEQDRGALIHEIKNLSFK